MQDVQLLLLLHITFELTFLRTIIVHHTHIFVILLNPHKQYIYYLEIYYLEISGSHRYTLFS